jgi:hypothetical protein
MRRLAGRILTRREEAAVSFAAVAPALCGARPVTEMDREMERMACPAGPPDVCVVSLYPERRCREIAEIENGGR